jgi:Domain of unknown function (DUF4399)
MLFSLKSTVFSVVVVAALAGCSMTVINSAPLPPTPPARLTASTPVLAGGYKKVAAPAAAAVYFVNLKNGDVVTSPLLVQFGLRGIGVAPAGIEKENTGHHHLLVDVAELDVNGPLATTDNIRHFGGGQTEARIELKPGTHTLQLLLADHNHIPHHPVVASERITITVK